jgi:hypothetical protein
VAGAESGLGIELETLWGMNEERGETLCDGWYRYWFKYWFDDCGLGDLD